MEYGVFGISHNTASVELREKFAMNPELQDKMLNYINSSDQMEVVAVSTCNRFEMYYLTEDGFRTIQKLLEELYEVDISDIQPHTYRMMGQDALRHLLKVVVGLDSRVLGETQILGQIKEAWLAAQENGVTGKILNSLFERAVRFGKKCHTEFALNHHSFSVSSVAVKMAKNAVGTLEGKSVLLIGAGEMARIAADHLQGQGLEEFIIANRTVDNALVLAEKVGAKVIPLSETMKYVEKVDVVISSITTTDYFLKKVDVAAAMVARGGRPLVLIDIGVPRNLDPEIGQLPDVQLFDIDSITSTVEENERMRRQVADKIDEYVEKELEEISKWLHSELVTPLIKELTGQVELIQQETMRKIKNKIPQLDENMYNVVNHFSNQAIKKIINNPIKKLREISTNLGDANVQEKVNYFADLFDLQNVNDPQLQRLVSEFTSSEEEEERGDDKKIVEVVK